MEMNRPAGPALTGFVGLESLDLGSESSVFKCQRISDTNYQPRPGEKEIAIEIGGEGMRARGRRRHTSLPPSNHVLNFISWRGSEIDLMILTQVI